MIITWDKTETGHLGHGRERTYLIMADAERAEVRLTRWSTRFGGDMHDSPAVQALRNAVLFPLGRGPGRPPGEPELNAMVLQVQQDCQRYENGERVDWVLQNPAWRGVSMHQVYMALDEFQADGEEPFDIEAGLERVIRRWAAESLMPAEDVEATLARGRQALMQHGLIRHGTITGRLPGPVSDAAVEAEVQADEADRRSSPEL